MIAKVTAQQQKRDKLIPNRISNKKREKERKEIPQIVFVDAEAVFARELVGAARSSRAVGMRLVFGIDAMSIAYRE